MGASISLSIARLPSLLRWYGAAKTAWSVLARIIGPRSIGAITRPLGSCVMEATSDTVRHADAPRSAIVICGLKIKSINGFAERPRAAKLAGDTASAKRTRFRPGASVGHRMARLAAKIGAASIVAAAVPRISQKLNPISAASVMMPRIQRNRTRGLDRIRAAEAKPIVINGNP